MYTEKPTSTFLTFRIDKIAHEFVQLAARATGQSVSELARGAVLAAAERQLSECWRSDKCQT